MYIQSTDSVLPQEVIIHNITNWLHFTNICNENDTKYTVPLIIAIKLERCVIHSVGGQQQQQQNTTKTSEQTNNQRKLQQMNSK